MQRSGVLPDRVWDKLHDSEKLADFIKVHEVGGILIYVRRDHYDAWMASTDQGFETMPAVRSP